MKKRKLFNLILTGYILLALFPLGFFIWEYKQGNLDKEVVTFWFALIGCPIFSMHGTFALITGQSWAKGVSIERNQTPKVFFVNVIFSFLVSFVCLIGIVYYYKSAL